MVTLIKFTGTNCLGCERLSKVLSETKHNFEVVEYNIESDEGQDVAIQYQVMTVPTLIKIEDGEETDRMMGFNLPDFRRIMK